jgi:hypothetical protein
MMAPRVIPVSIWPANWCLNCKDPDHAALESCTILTLRRQQDGNIDYVPCGCTNNMVFGEQGKYLVAVTELQYE